MSEWRLQVAPSAERLLARLPERVATAIVEFIVGPLLEAPERVGKPLQRELQGYHSARRGAYRIVCRLDPKRDVIRAVRIEHRADVYREHRTTSPDAGRAVLGRPAATAGDCGGRRGG